LVSVRYDRNLGWFRTQVLSKLMLHRMLHYCRLAGTRIGFLIARSSPRLQQRLRACICDRSNGDASLDGSIPALCRYQVINGRSNGRNFARRRVTPILAQISLHPLVPSKQSPLPANASRVSCTKPACRTCWASAQSWHSPSQWECSRDTTFAANEKVEATSPRTSLRVICPTKQKRFNSDPPGVASRFRGEAGAAPSHLCRPRQWDRRPPTATQRRRRHSAALA